MSACDAAVQTLDPPLDPSRPGVPLLAAAERGDTATALRVLAQLAAGDAAVNARDEHRRTVLHYAAMHADVVLLESVLQWAGAGSGDGGHSGSGDGEAGRAFVDVNAVNASGLTPCHCAACPCPVRLANPSAPGALLLGDPLPLCSAPPLPNPGAAILRTCSVRMCVRLLLLPARQGRDCCACACVWCAGGFRMHLVCGVRALQAACRLCSRTPQSHWRPWPGSLA
jgi:hypothetical protein